MHRCLYTLYQPRRSSKMTTNFYVDEFGRDSAFRSQYFRDAYRGEQHMNQLIKVFATMSWSEFCYAKEDEEECQRIAEEKQRKYRKQQGFQALAKQRRILATKGLYEPEEGEVLE